MDAKLTKGGTCQFFTTESEEKFKKSASVFLNADKLDVKKITLV